MVSFIKMHGLGNDFVIIDLDANQGLEFSIEHIRLMCDRKYGIGADQLVTIKRISNTTIQMGIFNSDGSKSNACGNATRCIASYLHEIDGMKSRIIVSELGDTINTKILENNMVESSIPSPKFEWQDIPLARSFDKCIEFFDFPNLPVGYFVNVGNPHIVFFVDDVRSINLEYYGKAIENHEYFPEKVNVNFAEITSPHNIILRTFERGTGLTLACGTGAAASAVCAIKYMNLKNIITVSMLGGDLKVEYNGDNIITTGPTTKVFSGEWYIHI